MAKDGVAGDSVAEVAVTGKTIVESGETPADCAVQ